MNKKITSKEWALFILIAILCAGLWFKLEYPRFIFLDFSLDRQKALTAAEEYLKSQGIGSKEYLKAIIFDSDDWADRYLQKTLGPVSEEEFLRNNKYELFSWKARFFKEFKKEEYLIRISPKTGQVLSFNHLIEDIESRGDNGKEASRSKAEKFLRDFYGFDLNSYDFHEEKIKRYDRRTDYSFSWEKKGVYIPWQKEQGGAKLLIGVTVSGDQVREFYKGRLDIPEKFRRYIDNQFAFGGYLSSFFFLLFILLLGWSVYIVVKRKSAVALRLSKNWFLYLTVFLAISIVADSFNDLQSIIIDYPTHQALYTFLGTLFVKLIVTIIFISIAFIMPGLAGESLRSEVLPDNRYSSFLHYIKSSFYSRNIAISVLLGYTFFFIMLGVQAAIFYFGQKYLGVWREWSRLTQLSSTYLPFFSAFVIGITASFSEEIIFRLFGITWAKKYLKNIVLALIISSFIWGLGHSRYAIFPTWFRTIEVSLIGLLYGLIFIRYGLLPLIVAHYLFDVFWGVAAYILGHSNAYLYTSSMFVLLIPLIFACIAFFLNKTDKERQVSLLLNPVEKYNLNILIAFLTAKKAKWSSPEEIKNELIIHNWDPVLVDLALKEVFGIAISC